jgi:hypothetical protein
MTATAALQAAGRRTTCRFEPLGLRLIPSVDEDLEELRILHAAAQLSGAE